MEAADCQDAAQGKGFPSGPGDPGCFLEPQSPRHVDATKFRGRTFQQASSGQSDALRLRCSGHGTPSRNPLCSSRDQAPTSTGFACPSELYSIHPDLSARLTCDLESSAMQRMLSLNPISTPGSLQLAHQVHCQGCVTPLGLQVFSWCHEQLPASR